MSNRLALRLPVLSVLLPNAMYFWCVAVLGYVTLTAVQSAFIQCAFAQTGTETPTPEPTATPTGVLPPSIVSEGISGDVDKKHRSPLVSIGTDYTKGDGTSGSEKARILVDASIPNGDYQKYPIRFDFYVNRQFFTSQLRSTELPGPIGIEVPAERAKVPFNYSVVATLLHPNREFTTVIHGAIFATELSSTLSSCTYTVANAVAAAENTSESTAFTSSEVEVEQLSNNSVTLAFTTSTLKGGESADDEISIEAALAFAGTVVSGTVKQTIDSQTQSSAVTGTGAIGDNGVSSLSVSSSDKGITLACE